MTGYDPRTSASVNIRTSPAATAASSTWGAARQSDAPDRTARHL